MTPPLRFGAFAPQGWKLEYSGWSAADAWAHSVEVATLAEALGYDHLWVYDHVETVPRREPTHVFEAFTLLAAVAQHTTRVGLGQLVTCAAYRNPGLLAQMAVTVDAASGGRVVLGLGAGWDEDEYRAFGYGAELPPIAERLRHLDETLQIVRKRFDGPVLVGGAGERVLLRLVAQHADACNLTDSFEPEFYRHKLDVLRRHCEELGRDYDSILRTASFTVPSDVDRDVLDRLAAAGITYFILYVTPPGDVAALERLAATLL